MRKLLSIFLVIALIVSLASISAFAADDDKVSNNLISEDLEWVMTPANGSDATWSYKDGKLTVISADAWPNITAETEIVVSPEDEIAIDFELVSGNVNIYLKLETADGTSCWVYVHETIEPDKLDSGSGDLNVVGAYTGSFQIKDAKGNTENNAVPANVKTIPESESYTIKSITICPVGTNGTVVINSFTVTSDAPAESTPETSGTGEENPKTGDSAMIFAFIALVAMGGAVVVARKVR